MRVFPIGRFDFNYYFQNEIEDQYETSIAPMVSRGIGRGLKEVKERDNLYGTLEHLRAISSTRKSNIAYDMVFAAPKTVSVLWALSEESQAGAILKAHREAVETSIGYLELTETWTSIRDKVVAADGVRAFEFSHLLSRNQDPHIHSHVVLLNGANYDGEVRAINSARLYRVQPVLEIIYRSELAHRLYDSVGFGLRGSVLGSLELGNLDQGVVAEFSSRRRQVLDASEHFGGTYKSRQVSSLRTRVPKNGASLSELRLRWHSQAEDFGLHPTRDGRRPSLDFGLTPVFVSPVPDIFHSEFLYRLGSSRSLDTWGALRTTCEVLLENPREPGAIATNTEIDISLFSQGGQVVDQAIYQKALGVGLLSQMVSPKVKARIESLVREPSEETAVREKPNGGSGVRSAMHDFQGSGRTVRLGRTAKEQSHFGGTLDAPKGDRLLLGRVDLEMRSFTRLAFSQIEAAHSAKMIQGLVRRSQCSVTFKPNGLELAAETTPVMTLDEVSANLSVEVFLTREQAVASAQKEVLLELSNESPIGIHIFKSSAEAQSFREEIVAVAQHKTGSVMETKWGKLLLGEVVAVLPVRKRPYLFRIDDIADMGQALRLTSLRGERFDVGSDFGGKILPMTAVRSDALVISRLTDYASLIPRALIYDSPNMEQFETIGSWPMDVKLKTSLEAPEFSSTQLLLLSRLGKLEGLVELRVGSIDEEKVAKSFAAIRDATFGKSVRLEIDKISRAKLLLMQSGLSFRDELREMTRVKGELGVARDIYLQRFHRRSPSDFGRELW